MARSGQNDQIPQFDSLTCAQTLPKKLLKNQITFSPHLSRWRIDSISNRNIYQFECMHKFSGDLFRLCSISQTANQTKTKTKWIRTKKETQSHQVYENRSQVKVKWATNKKSTRLIHACLRLRVVRSNLRENISFVFFGALHWFPVSVRWCLFCFKLRHMRRDALIYTIWIKWNVQEKCTHIAITFEAWNELRIQKFSVRDGNDDSNSDDDDDAQIWRINKNRFFL